MNRRKLLRLCLGAMAALAVTPTAAQSYTGVHKYDCKKDGSITWERVRMNYTKR